MQRNKSLTTSQKPKVVPIEMDATFFFERAVQSLDRFHYDKALKYFRRAVEYEPDNPVNHCNMAGILSELGNYKESNHTLQHILDHVDPTMTECYFYMANNYANLEDFESAEEMIVRYLEVDPSGQFLEESEELLDFLSTELERPTQLRNIKCREGLFEHDKARGLLEEGEFTEAVRVLERLTKKHPDFMAAHNNLALAYYYMGQFDKSLSAIYRVLDMEEGNMHALCNLAIFYQHFDEQEKLKQLLDLLSKTYPYHTEHVFKLATTMGILGEHEAAYRHFRRLLRVGEIAFDPCLYHYTAVAACNTGQYEQARKLWKQASMLDPDSEIPRFYLSELEAIQSGRKQIELSYHYHLPFEEQFRTLVNSGEVIPDRMKRDPLVRSSFFWALRHGDHETKLQVIQAFGMIADSEMEAALRDFVADPDEDDYLKKISIFVLRSMGTEEPLHAIIDGKPVVVTNSQLSPQLPDWDEKWRDVMEISLMKMRKRYDMIQQHDLQTLWVEFLTRVYPEVPKITKVEGWAAALEYLTAKMHRQAISYHEVAQRYGISITTVSKNVKVIDEVCGLRQKMDAIFPRFT